MPPDQPRHGPPKLFIDNQPFDWDKPTITGAEIRKLGGLPDNVQIFQKVPGKPDREIHNETKVDLKGPGPERFSSQAVGSGAG
jgi:hypothetical protein